LLWIGAGPVPQNVRQATGKRWDIKSLDRRRPLGDQLRNAEVAVVCPTDNGGDALQLGVILRELEGSSAIVVFMMNEESRVGRKMLSDRHGQFFSVPTSVSAEVLEARISTAWDLQPAIAELRADIFSLRDANGVARGAPEALDEEMRLASRLQRDFLPRRLPEVGRARFAVLYRPVSFVSGDIYDITRLDETHVGFYIADAVGHGLPAALLTMFIKKALQTKRIVGNTYEIVAPDASLAQLNEDICSQELSSCQFCTALYGVLDVSTLTLTYARAGHPEPLLVHRGGSTESLNGDGCLLGIFEDAVFEPCQIRLSPGDRIILHTDGACDSVSGDCGRKFSEVFGSLVTLPRTEMMVEITSQVEEACSKGLQIDDITVMVVDIEP